MLSCLKNTDTATPCPNGSGQPTENHADDKPKLQKTVSLSTAGHSSPNVKDPKVLVINTGGTIGMMEHENGLSPKANVFVETLRKLSFLHDEQYAQQKRLKKDILVLPFCKHGPTVPKQVGSSYLDPTEHTTAHVLLFYAPLFFCF